MKTLIILLALLLAGCEDPLYFSIGSKHIAEAERACRKNGGVRHINVGQSIYDVHCLDGASFRSISK